MTQSAGAKSAGGDLQSRIERMYSGDKFAALVALATVWATYIFVLYEMSQVTLTTDVFYMLATGATLVLIFNTAAIFAMITHYGEEKASIYGLDLHYLDLMNKK